MIHRFKYNFFLLAALFGVAGLIGCASGGDQANKQANAPTNAAENARSGVKAPPRVEIKSGDKIGVAECDRFLEKYEACLKTKVPEPGRSAMQSSVDSLRNSWITIAVNPETRENLAKDCRQNLEETKKILSAYACAW